MSHVRSHLRILSYTIRPLCPPTTARSLHLLVEIVLRNFQILLPSAPRPAYYSNPEECEGNLHAAPASQVAMISSSALSHRIQESVTNINQNRGILQFPVLQARQVLSVVRATLQRVHVLS